MNPRREDEVLALDEDAVGVDACPVELFDFLHPAREKKSVPAMTKLVSDAYLFIRVAPYRFSSGRLCPYASAW
jgi:hypothetical protein